MESFVEKHADRVSGVLSCFDRVLFKGHLPLNRPGAMDVLLNNHGVLVRDFKPFVARHSERIKAAARAMAEESGRPYLSAGNGQVRKDEVAAQIARRDAVSSGLVCVLTAVEACSSFRVIPGEGRPLIVRDRRKCLCLYFYFLDPRFGLIHVRITTWFPFMVQVCLNGHDWLAARLTAERIGFIRCDNAFLRIDDCGRAQQLADQFVRQDWPQILSAFAAKVNPLLGDLLAGMTYYWVTDQAEYATDVMFRDAPTLQPLYGKLLEHALVCFGAEDVLAFLGRRLQHGFAGEVLNDMKRRWPGARIKHRMKENWIKMYDKHGVVLRVETVINDPYEFKIRRHGIRQGRVVTDWFPMAKGVGNLYRYAEVCRAANHRYLDALAVVPHPGQARQSLHDLGRRIRHAGRSYRGFNPLSGPDAALFAAVLRGEHAIHGFRNRDIRACLFPHAPDPAQQRRQAARTSRLLKILHVHGLIAKIPRTRRWRVTDRGNCLLATMLKVHAVEHPDTLLATVA